MDAGDRGRSRRRFLLAGSLPLVGLAGCTGTPWDDDQAGESTPRPEGWCLEELADALPDEYDGAESIDGIRREPDGLTSKADAGYQCHPQGYQRCSNCRFFVQSLGGEYAGACTQVAGEIRTQDWCARYRPTDRLDETPDPNPIDRTDDEDEG